MRKLIFAILTFFILGLIGSYSWRKWHYQKRETQFDHIIKNKANKYHIPASLVKAVIARESRFIPNARGSFKEYGLMQIRSMVADDWCRAQKRPKLENYGILLKPELNIEIGTWYLAKAYHKWSGYKEQIELALAQYNAGPKRIYDWKPQNDDGLFFTRITINSTKNYITYISAQEKLYKEDF